MTDKRKAKVLKTSIADHEYGVTTVRAETERIARRFVRAAHGRNQR